MPSTEWSLKGLQVSTCNCAWGCPCQFNALPTHGDCRAAIAMRIDEGHFGGVRLDGLKVVSCLAWPGAIHEGGGEVQAVIDERASQAQRNALLTILKGEETEPGATIFNVLTGTIDTVHKPLFLPIEFASSATKAQGCVPHDWTGGHSHLFILHMTKSRSRARVTPDRCSPDRSTAVEALLRRDRAIVLAGLAAIAGSAWVYTLVGTGLPQPGAGNMSMAATAGAAMFEPMPWSPGHAALMVLMWWLMMIAMMVPAAAPMVLLFAAVNRKQRNAGNPYVPTGIFVAGYLSMWGLFSLFATAGQWGLESTGLLIDMASVGPVLGGVVLLAAGLYQLTPIKQACLRHCRSPIMFLTQHWRQGPGGALRMGLAHGAYCLGCCWFLMALLFFGGIMNVLWIAGLAVYVLFEKTVPAGHWLSYATGAALSLWGLTVLATGW